MPRRRVDLDSDDQVKARVTTSTKTMIMKEERKEGRKEGMKRASGNHPNNPAYTQDETEEDIGRNFSRIAAPTADEALSNHY
jgi:hypothetical protein